MVDSKKNLKELRGGAIVAMVATCLFVLVLGSFGASGTGERNLSAGVLYTVHPQIAEYAATPPAPPGRGGATAVPVFCHHFLRKDTSPFEVVKILGALFLNLPLIDHMVL